MIRALVCLSLVPFSRASGRTILRRGAASIWIKESSKAQDTSAALTGCAVLLCRSWLCRGMVCRRGGRQRSPSWRHWTQWH